MAGLLTLPIAGTALYILDQYPNPRNLAAFAAVFAVAEVLRRKYVAATLWLVFAAAVHPLMASFAIAFCVWLRVLDRFRPAVLGFAAMLPFGLTLDPPPSAYHEVALRQPSFFIQHWRVVRTVGADRSCAFVLVVCPHGAPPRDGKPGTGVAGDDPLHPAGHHRGCRSLHPSSF